MSCTFEIGGLDVKFTNNNSIHPMFVSLCNMLQNWTGGHVGVGMGALPLVGLVGWGFVLGCYDTVGSLQLESHHSWLARGVPFCPLVPMCFTSPFF